MRVEPGSRLGDFEIEGRLGAGGMAQVWVARDTRTDGRFALKLLRSDQARMRARLLREGRAQASLSHPNLLPVLGTIVDGGDVALVLPLVHGPSLDAHLEQRRLEPDEAIAVLVAIARGLAHAHRFQLVHRDVKPGNVLLDLQGGRVVPRVSDFGLVKADDPLLATMQGSMLGTPGYAAPEQLADAASVDARADIWSMGVLLVELLTGERPAAEPTGVVARAAERERAVASLPPPLAGLARELLQPNREDRLPSCGVLVARLEALLPPGADPLGPHGRLASALAAAIEAPGERPAAPTWAEDDLRSRMIAAPSAPPALSVGDFVTRHGETVFREGSTRAHYGRLALALVAALAAALLGARCG